MSATKMIEEFAVEGLVLEMDAERKVSRCVRPSKKARIGYVSVFHIQFHSVERMFEHAEKHLVEIEAKDQIRNFQPPISGDLIMKSFGIGPGPEVGIIKNIIREAILEGEIPNDFDRAHQMMLDEGRRMGLKVQEKKPER